MGNFWSRAKNIDSLVLQAENVQSPEGEVHHPLTGGIVTKDDRRWLEAFFKEHLHEYATYVYDNAVVTFSKSDSTVVGDGSLEATIKVPQSISSYFRTELNSFLYEREREREWNTAALFLLYERKTIAEGVPPYPITL